MSNKVSKNPMCCGPIIDNELIYLCMAPSYYECACGKCDNWYSCKEHLTDMTITHFKLFKIKAKWYSIIIEKIAKVEKNNA